MHIGADRERPAECRLLADGDDHLHVVEADEVLREDGSGGAAGIGGRTRAGAWRLHQLPHELALVLALLRLGAHQGAPGPITHGCPRLLAGRVDEAGRVGG